MQSYIFFQTAVSTFSERLFVLLSINTLCVIKNRNGQERVLRVYLNCAQISYEMRILGLLVSVMFFIHLNSVSGQTIKGKVTDQSTGETLIGVNIFSDDNTGVATNIDGEYSLKLAAGSHTVTFKFIGYQEVKKKFTLGEGETVTFDASLPLESTTLDLVVVTGSQFEKKLEEEMVTIDVVQNYLIQNTASPDLKAAVSKVPGVTILDGQVSIRGGSGYSYGVGSRVQLVIDDVPLLTGDLKDIQWSAIPLETAEQIEVVKGSSSSMYGSGAMNGVIHVRTGWAKEKPETEFRIYHGLYGTPRAKEARWWEGTFSPMFTGVFFSHRRKIKNLDLVVGGHGSSDLTYLQRGHRQAIRLNFKTRYRDQKIQGLSYGINGNVQFQQSGRFILWKDDLGGAYVPLDGTSSQDKYLFANVDPYAHYSSDVAGLHSLRMRYFRVERRNDKWEDPSASNVLFLDYRFQKEFKYNFHLIAGIQYQYVWSASSLYPDAGTIYTHNPAVFAQVEKSFFDKRLTVLFGIRDEWNEIVSVSKETSNPIFRGGVNVKVAKKTHLRTSFGQSFRFPSIGEKYLQASLGVIDIRPSQDLQAERGWSAELGLKQGFRVSGWHGNFDVALFWSEYRDMIEYALRVDTSGIYFKPLNVSKARVAGFELGLQGDGKIGPIPLRVYLGYTFNYPADLESDTTQENFGIYMQNLFTSISNPDSLSDLSILKYRIANVFKADIELDLWKFTLGYTVEYTSYMDRIDASFESLLPGFSDYRQLHNGGVWRMDARLGVKIGKNSTVAFIAKNFLNEFYSVRPGVMEPPRNFTIQYNLKI